MNLNEGKALQYLTSILGTLSMVLSAIVSIWIMVELELVLLGFGILTITWFIITVVSLFVDAFATLVDKTCLIESYLNKAYKGDDASDFVNKYLKSSNSESFDTCEKCGKKSESVTRCFINRETGFQSLCDDCKHNENGEWICSKCGKCNDRNTGICDCGQLKSNNR